MEESDLKEESRALSIHSAGGGRRPVKVWNANRSIRKALVVSTYEEFIRKGRHKLGFGILEPLRIVLESDGTQVDDGEYFQTLRENSVFLFLRPGESWIPGGGPDALRSAMIEAIPPIVTETLSSLGLLDQIPSWKIMDNKGRVTVVLHWERGSDSGAGSEGPRLPRKSSSLSTLSHARPGSGAARSSRSTPCLSRDSSRNSSILFGSSMDGGSKPEESLLVPKGPGPLWRKGPPPSLISGGPRVLSRQGSSLDSGGLLHFHTPQCCAPGRLIHDPPLIKRDSPPQGSSVECDFHCCALHVISSGGGGEIKMSGGLPPTSAAAAAAAAAASASGAGPSSSSTAPELKRSATKGAHVRFCNIDGEGGGLNSGTEGTGLLPGGSKGGGGASSRAQEPSLSACSIESHTKILVNGGRSSPESRCNAAASCSSDSSSSSSSDSDLEGGCEDPPTPRFLLLIDSPPPPGPPRSLEQPSGHQVVEHHHHYHHHHHHISSTTSKSVPQPANDHTRQPAHLSIKDIGIILERLSSRIGDVERLEKEAMGGLVVHWTIKALLKGGEGRLRELGILYNNAYYSISEHPGYQTSPRLPGEEEEEEDVLSEEEEDAQKDGFFKQQHPKPIKKNNNLISKA